MNRKRICIFNVFGDVMPKSPKAVEHTLHVFLEKDIKVSRVSREEWKYIDKDYTLLSVIAYDEEDNIYLLGTRHIQDPEKERDQVMKSCIRQICRHIDTLTEEGIQPKTITAIALLDKDVLGQNKHTYVQTLDFTYEDDIPVEKVVIVISYMENPYANEE